MDKAGDAGFESVFYFVNGIFEREVQHVIPL